MNTSSLKIAFLSGVFGFSILITGCKTTGKYVRWYEGPPMQTNSVAILLVPRTVSLWNARVILTVDKIDGKPIVHEKFTANIAEKIELLPGEHQLWVAYFKGGVRSVHDAQISFVAEPGKTYELNAAEEDRSFGKALRQELFFGRWHWTIWVVDAGSKKVVAGIPRETPLRWFEK